MFFFSNTVSKRLIEPPRPIDEDFVDSPATTERKYKEANMGYIKRMFKNMLSQQGISDEMLQDSR